MSKDVLHLAHAAAHVILEGPCVFIAVGPDKLPFAVFLVFLVLSTVVAPRLVIELALTVNVIIRPIPCVLTPVCKIIRATAAAFILLPFTFVLVAIDVDIYSLTMGAVLVPLA